MNEQLTPRPGTFYSILESIETYMDTIAAAEAALTTPLSLEEEADARQSIVNMYAELEVVGQQLIDKADSIVAVLGQMKAQIGIVKSEEERLANRRAVFEKAKKWLEQYTIDCMNARGMKQLKTATCTIRPQGNGGVKPLKVDPFRVGDSWYDVFAKMDQAVWEALEEAGVEIQFVSREPSNARIRKALEAGDEVTGARLDERGQHLRIT